MINVARETAISTVINMLFSAAFFAALFGFSAPVMVGGRHGLGADCLPQGFMVALMGALVPSLIARAKSGTRRPTVGRVVGRSFILALLVSLLAGGGAWMLLASLAPASLSPGQALLIKLVFAALVSLTVTPLALSRLGAQAQRAT